MAKYNPLLEIQWEIYRDARNTQIANWKLEGKSWQQIANIVGLSKGYVKTIAHQQGVYGFEMLQQQKKKKSQSFGEQLAIDK